MVVLSTPHNLHFHVCSNHTFPNAYVHFLNSPLEMTSSSQRCSSRATPASMEDERGFLTPFHSSMRATPYFLRDDGSYRPIDCRTHLSSPNNPTLLPTRPFQLLGGEMAELTLPSSRPSQFLARVQKSNKMLETWAVGKTSRRRRREEGACIICTLNN